MIISSELNGRTSQRIECDVVEERILDIAVERPRVFKGFFGEERVCFFVADYIEQAGFQVLVAG